MIDMAANQTTTIEEDNEMGAIRSMLNKIADAITQASKLSKEVAEMRQEMASLKEEVARLSARNEALAQEVEGLRAERERNLEEIRSLRYQVEETTKVNELTISENQRLNKELERSQQDHNQLWSEHKAAMNDFDQVKETLVATSQARDDAQYRVAELEEALAKAKAKLDNVLSAIHS